MSVSRVGSSYSYIYNAATGKLSSKDGNADEFVDYLNGDLSAAMTSNYSVNSN